MSNIQTGFICCSVQISDHNSEQNLAHIAHISNQEILRHLSKYSSNYSVVVILKAQFRATFLKVSNFLKKSLFICFFLQQAAFQILYVSGQIRVSL